MKALVLFSGGLDSMIAIKLLTNQGIDVTAVHIDIGFSGDEKKAEILRRRAYFVLYVAVNDLSSARRRISHPWATAANFIWCCRYECF